MKSIYNKFQFFWILVVTITSSLINVYGQKEIYVTKSGSPDPTGTVEKPFHVIQPAVSKAQSNEIKNITIGPGKYYEELNISTPCILTAKSGTVIIGETDYKNSTNFDILTLNTHLAGDQIGMPSWKDKARAYDIAHYFDKNNIHPDVVAFQEIWDEDLFYGGDGAAGILPMSGYLTGKHGSQTGGNPANSGLALMSKYELINFSQESFKIICSGADCLANKGWITTTINKDNFNIRIYNLHAQANEAPDIRKLQFLLLYGNILSYRDKHPDDVVFVIGDFNVFGESSEYDESLIPVFGYQLGGKDADHNSPNFIRGGEKTITVSNQNKLAMHFDDDTIDGRLDYIFYFPSKNGSCEIVPINTEVNKFLGRVLADDGLSTNQSSDHWAVYSKFKLIRTKSLPQVSDDELLVRTLNTAGKKKPYYYYNNPLRLRGIAQEIHKDWSERIGLIGMQEVRGGMTACLTSDSNTNGAKCLAAELSTLFGNYANSRFTGGNKTTENGIIVGSNWRIISSKHWGIHSTFLGIGAGHRKLIEALVEHKTKKFRLRFYSVHFTPGWDEKKERKHQAKRVVEIIKERAKIGELPPVLVGDFNNKKDSLTGEDEESIKFIERHFWRAVDSLSSYNGIDRIYIGEKSSFPLSNGKYEPVERRHIQLRKKKEGPYIVDSHSLKALSDHNSEGFRLKIKYTPLPYIVWWEEKDFKGTSHKRELHPQDYGKCLRLVHNDKMKSIKFYGSPGWKLNIFDNGNCKKDDDWGLITFPNDPNVSVVEVPKIGKQGPASSVPQGSYEFHFNNGIVGEVTAIKHVTDGSIIGYDYEGIQGYIFSTQKTGTVPLYMLYNSSAGDHFYTISSSGAGEISGWKPRGIVGYVYPNSGQSDRNPVYRWYKPSPNRPKKTDHFYTMSQNEPRPNSGYVYEGIECYLPSKNTAEVKPFYRWYKGSINDHFYTTSKNEPTAGSGYVSEGIMGYVFPSHTSGTVPLYWLYSNKAKDHFYTTSTNGTGSIGSWKPEGIAGYVFSGPEPSNKHPLYRWYKPSPQRPIKTDHFYTTSTNEPTSNSGYVFEGIECYLPIKGTEGSVPLYRFYNSRLNDHYYSKKAPDDL